jgi:hypothetical protein
MIVGNYQVQILPLGSVKDILWAEAAMETTVTQSSVYEA